MKTLQRTIERFVLPSIVLLFMTACLDSNLTAPDLPGGGFGGHPQPEEGPPAGPGGDELDEWHPSSECTGRVPRALELDEDRVCPLP